METSIEEPISQEPTTKKKKKTHGNNEASVGRWIAFFFILMFIYLFFGSIGVVIGKLTVAEGELSWLPETLSTFAGFAMMFLASVFMLNKFMKTRFRDFVFGKGGSINFKTIGMILGCWILGIVISLVFDLAFGNTSSISVNPIGLKSILITLAMALVFTWMQTSYEEIVFRGVFLRAACGNKIAPTAKCIIFGIISSAFFMMMHFANPEMISQSNTLDLVAAGFNYFLMGAIMYFANMAFGDLMPGMFIHWINNFYGFAIITEEVSAVQTGAIFFVSGSSSGVSSLLSILVTYAPIIILSIVYFIRRYKNKETAPQAK